MSSIGQPLRTLGVASTVALAVACQGSPKATEPGAPARSEPIASDTGTAPAASRTAEAPRPLVTNPARPPLSASPSASGPALLPPPATGVEACVAACVHARMMEAVGAEVIEASCREQCRSDPKAYPR